MRLRYHGGRAHSYWLDTGNGFKRCKSISAIAKVPDDTHALDTWRRRKTLQGVALRPDEFLPRISAADGDNDALETIADEALDAAGGSIGRQRGSAIHLISERLDAGHDLLATPDVIRVSKLWRGLLDHYGLKVRHIEGIVVWPELGIAGRFDRVVEGPDGQLYIDDIKTGAQADIYVHAHAIQLYLYAGAPLLAIGPQGDENFETDQFEPMIPVSQEIGFVSLLQDNDNPRLLAMDLKAGREIFERAILPIFDWRARTDLVLSLPWETHLDGRPLVEPAGVDEAGYRRLYLVPETSPTQTEGLSTEGLQAQFPGSTLIDLATPERREWARTRTLRLIQTMPDGTPAPETVQTQRQQWLKQYWPEGVPTFKKTFGHTDEQIDKIAALLDKCETAWDFPFGPSDPKAVKPRTIVDVISEQLTTDNLRGPAPGVEEGPNITPEEQTTLKSIVKGMMEHPSTPSAAVLARRYAAQADQAGFSLNIDRHPSRRRWLAVTGLVLLLDFHGIEDEDLILAVLAMCDTLDEAETVGEALARFTLRQLEDFKDIASGLGKGYWYERTSEGKWKVEVHF